MARLGAVFVKGGEAVYIPLTKRRAEAVRMQPSGTTELTKMNKNSPRIIGLGIVTRKGEKLETWPRML